MIIHNIEFLEEDTELFPDGSVHEATLAQDTIIQGIPCAGNRSVVFYPSGQLKLCWLSSITILNNIPCENNLVYLHENGRLWNVSLAADRQINEVLHSSGSRLTFDETGELLEYSQFLDRDQWIEGLPCSSQFFVWRYASGRPSVIVLSSNHVINGEEYPRGAKIFLNEDGEIIDRQLLNLDSAHRYKQQVSGIFEINWS
ncbi:MAG: hypothetical protein HC916_19110 [Coleofasciculaceae cyanobacterium SM2_1_6]|nr:hypothetical protein [Coleofasciculaceae cyanobacterium SM2_1_6]